MRGVVLTLSWLFLGIVLLLAGNGLLGTLLAVRLSLAGISPVGIGTILAAYFAGFALGTLYAGRVISSAGHIRAFAALAAGVAAIALAHGLSPPSWLWALLRAMSGFAMAGVYITIESWLHTASPPELRGRVVSLYLMSAYAGLGIGQLLLDTWSVEGLELFTLVGLLMSLAVLPVALARTEAPPIEPFTRLPLRTLLRRAPLGAVTSLAAGILTGSLFASAPVYAQSSGFSPRGVSLLMAALLLGGLLLQWPLGWTSDRWDRRKVLLLMTLSLAALATAGAAGPLGAGPVLYALALGLGGLDFAFYPVALTYVFERVRRSEASGASAALNLVFAVGAVLGPLLTSTVVAGLGPRGFFVTQGAVAAALAAYAVRRIHVTEAIPPDEREPFVMVPDTTPMASELDPRTPEPDEPD